MANNPQILTIPGRFDMAVGGFDTVVINLPEYLYDAPALLYPTLQAITDNGAAQLGETLHHAEWVVTRDPAVVAERGKDVCVSCRAQLDQALAYLRDHPEIDLLVGTLYWVLP